MTARPLALIAVFAPVFGVLFAQSDTPKFDIADVHPSARLISQFPFMTGGILRSGRYDLRKATMLDLIRTAYDVEPSMVQEGPSWLEMDRFDIAAKAPQTTSSANVKLMLQSLLAERFKLVVRKDMKPMPAYLLKVGAKSKLREASGSEVAGCQPVPQKNEPGSVFLAFITCRNVSMEDFAKVLRNFGGDYLTTIPVVDATDLKGTWDFDLKWNLRMQLAQAGSDATSLFAAIDKQLGLKLDLEKAPAPALFVESVNEMPTPNLPDVATVLPPQPHEFEVADIKLSRPDEPSMNRAMPGGRIEFHAITLKRYIMTAWGLGGQDDRLIGAPKGIDDTKFDIVAKTQSATSSTQYDEDDIEMMDQALLADRFKLKAHMEERPFPAYTLVAVKPRLTKADPSNRTGCKEAATVAKDPRDSNPARARLVTCLNVTMAQFADQLQRIAPGYIYTPVLDSTGIEGNYDITLSFSPIGVVKAGGRGGPPANGAQNGGAPTAADPSGGLTLPEAISKQLGLKLEQQKRPVPVLVIDSVLEKPTDN